MKYESTQSISAPIPLGSVCVATNDERFRQVVKLLLSVISGVSGLP